MGEKEENKLLDDKDLFKKRDKYEKELNNNLQKIIQEAYKQLENG